MVLLLPPLSSILFVVTGEFSSKKYSGGKYSFRSTFEHLQDPLSFSWPVSCEKIPTFSDQGLDKGLSYLL